MASIKRFVPYFKPYKKIFFWDLFCVFVATVIELVFPKLVEVITGDATASGGINLRLVLIVCAALIILRAVEVVCRFFMVKWGHMS